MELVEYVDAAGKSPFGAWFNALPFQPAAKIAAGLAKLEQGNLAGAKGVGAGVMEHRIDAGPGYRVYFARDGDVLIILLAGGTKRRQQRDIEAAQARCSDYKARKRKS